MAQSVGRSLAPWGPLGDRLIERTEEIPEDPPSGDYVVVDTIHFSNTVIELLANGASYVHITDERGQEFAYREAVPDALIGGGSTDDYEPAPGYDFFNSPSYVQGLDVDGRPVSMTSSNGGRAVATLRSRDADGVDVFVGSPMNARALGEHLRNRGRPTYFVSSGSRGEVAIEDHIGAALVGHHHDRIPLSDRQREWLRRQVMVAKGPDYIDTHELRRRDVLDYAIDFDSRDVVPQLRGEALVDVSRSGRGRVGQAAD